MYVNHTGFELSMLEAAKEMMNFTYEIMNPKDLQWGALDAEGVQWSGIINGLAEGNIDFSLSNIITDTRLRVGLYE